MLKSLWNAVKAAATVLKSALRPSAPIAAAAAIVAATAVTFSWCYWVAPAGAVIAWGCASGIMCLVLMSCAICVWIARS